MDLFLKTEDRKLVEALNLAMGTRYRTEPYDLNDPDDFAEALTMVTAEYIDFLYYWGELDDVIEYFDGSIEAFYPAEWQKLALEEGPRKDIGRAFRSLRAAQSAVYKLVEKAEAQCRNMWLLAFTCAPDEVLEKVCGEALRAGPKELDQLLTFEFESSGQSIVDIWQYNVEKTAYAFGQALKKELEAMREYNRKAQKRGDAHGGQS